MSFWTKQRATKKPTDHGENMIELEKEGFLPQFSTELLMSVFKTSITDRKLRESLSKEKDFGVPKVVEQIQQKTYDRKNEKIQTRSSIIKTRKRNQRRTYTQKNIYRKIQNKAEKETKRTKLQILRKIKLEF